MKPIKFLFYNDYLKELYNGDYSNWKKDLLFREECLKQFFSDRSFKYSYQAYYDHCIHIQAFWESVDSVYLFLRYGSCVYSFCQLGSCSELYQLYSKPLCESELQQLNQLQSHFSGTLSDTMIRSFKVLFSEEMQLNFLKIKDFCESHSVCGLLPAALFSLMSEDSDIESVYSYILERTA